MSEHLPPVNSVAASRRKLLAVAALVVAFAGALPVVGYYMRERLIEKAGPVKVEVRNDSAERLRADIFAQGKSFTLEMDPKEHGLIRFNPSEPMDVAVRVLKRNVKTYELEEKNLVPKEEQHLTFRILGPTEVQVERNGAGHPDPQG